MKTHTSRLWKAAIAVLLMAAFIGGCKKDKFGGTVGVCPVVTSTNPANLATSVPFNQEITVTFNEKMNQLTLSQASLTLQGETPVAGQKNTPVINSTQPILKALTAVDGIVSNTDTTVSFTPSIALTPSTTYTGTVKASVKDLMGNYLQADYVWTFTTGAIVPPTVTSTDPANGATNVVLNKMIVVTFSAPMDTLTFNTINFTIRQGTTALAGTVLHTDTTVSFKPTVNLLSNTVYTATITSGVKNKVGINLAKDTTWTFTTGTVTAPMVTSTDPLNNTTGVVLNKIVTATFSVPMNPLTLTTTTFTLKQGATSVAGTISYTGSTASFTPTSSLLSGTIYTATITTGVKNVAGTPLANNYVWTFTTGIATAPTVTSTSPLNSATGVVLNQIVTANFSVPMDPLTITSSTFTLKQGVTSVAGTVLYIGTTASFTPTVNLLSNTVYTATITTGAKNIAGTPLVINYVWTFTTLIIPPPTVTLTNPVNLATNVPLNQVISATFSVPMDPLTITSSSFTLAIGVTPVAGAVNYSGSTATFTPTTLLLSDNTYTATITTIAKSLAGIPIASNFVWNFNTVPHLGPLLVNLNSVARFGIIAGVGVSNNAGFSVINNMDVGIYPGVRSSVTGFPPATVVPSPLYAIYASDDIAPPGTAAMLLQAQNDLVAAYNFAAAAVTPAPATVSGDLGGLTLAPGIYKSTSTLSILGGNLTLDAQGDVNATWIFQVASAFTTVGIAPYPSPTGGNVILTGGAQAKNIFWQVGSSATIGDYTSFYGNILAFSSITMNSHSTATGRMLARNAAVTMISTNIINKP